MSNLDLAIILAYIGLLAVLGTAARSKSVSVEEYALAGRNVRWWMAAITIFTADLSAISLLGSPAWTFQKDLGLAFGLVIFPFAAVAVAMTLIPAIVRRGTVSVYEYLERRFNRSARRFGAAIFLLLRGGWAATAVYATALALAETTSLPRPAATLLLGAATTGYVFLGGARSVVWVGIAQFAVMLMALTSIAGAVTHVSNGNLHALWQAAALGGHTRFADLSLSPFQEVTIWGVTVYIIVYSVTAFGTDQALAQRYLATPSRPAMLKAMLGNAALSLPLGGAMYLLGTLLAGYYALQPALSASLTEPSRVLPHFVAHALPSGLRGMVMAGVFGATLASVSAGLNSLATSTIVDFTRGGAEQRRVSLIRLATVAWGIGVSAAALSLGRLGAILEIAGKINGYFAGPLAGLFLLGLTCRRAHAWHAILACLLGAATTFSIAYLRVSWLWYGAVGCTATLSLGWALALLFPGQRDAADHP